MHKGPTDAANPVRLAAMVDYRTMRVLLLNLSSETKNLAGSGLAGQGYEIAIESGLTVDEVLALSPEVLVTEASPEPPTEPLSTDRSRASMPMGETGAD